MMASFLTFCILFGVMILVSCECPDDECRIIIFKEPIPNKVMKGHVFRMEVVANQGSCRVMCYMEPNCMSLNFGPLNGGVYKCELNNATEENLVAVTLREKKNYIYLAVENPCSSSSPCLNNGICQVGYTAKGFRCKCPPPFIGEYCEEEACNFDFESGIVGWEKTGTVFDNQPTFGDNPSARNRGEPSNHQGDWWIGGAEDRPCRHMEAGKLQRDIPQGTLTSASFLIKGQDISFLIGGGCNATVVRAELIVDNKVVRQETGNCTETMYRKGWAVQDLINQTARVKLIDYSSDKWGHINFDDLKGDIICEKNE